MKKAAIALVAASLSIGACTDRAERATPVPSPTPTTSPEADLFRTESQVYAAVIRRLVMKDHTFGSGRSPFDHVFIVDGAVGGAGKPMWSFQDGASQLFAEDLKQEILDRLTGLPPVEFVVDPDTVRKGRDGMGGVKGSGVIITLGRIERKAGELRVANGLWCGGLCGQWLTYVLERRGTSWRITGTTGPYVIS